MHLLILACSCIVHVEHVIKEYVPAEVEDPKEVYQEEQQEYMEADQVEDPSLEANFANSDPQQGKHRCMINPVSFTFESYNYYYTYAFKFIGVVWYLVAWVGFVYQFLEFPDN